MFLTTVFRKKSIFSLIAFISLILITVSVSFGAAVAADDVKARFAALGVESAPWSPAEFNDFVRRENAAWRPLIRDLGIKLDS